jgi:hypothetical protein
MPPAPLRLIAGDPSDLDVLSAALQDGIVRMKDVTWDKARRRLTVQLNRYRWEAADDAGRGERVRAALAVESVLAVRSKALRREAGEAVASLLALQFAPDAEPPGGVLTLAFAGGGALALSVECVDAVLADLSAPWPARARPDHEKDA